MLMRFVLYVLITFLGFQLVFYLLAPVYRFSQPKAFSGNKLYNPYATMDSSRWHRYNFQVQSYAWLGITNGRKNSNTLIDSVYHALGYDYVATSDYERINNHGHGSDKFIPTYEHGYNLFKTHQVLIGSSRVLWIDLMFGQTLSMKQWIIDKLRPDNQIIVLAHPRLRNGYTLNNLKYLTHYDLMEVLNNLRLSIPHWDTALSSGQVVYIVGNDDAHDVSDIRQVGRRFTMINSPDSKAQHIINNLKAGNAFGVDFLRWEKESLQHKAARLKKLPILESVKLLGDTLVVKVSRNAVKFRFIGQGGTVEDSVAKTSVAKYVIQPTDSYIRTEIIFASHTTFYLNPIIRYAGKAPHSLKTATVDWQITGWLRIVYFVLFIAAFYFFTTFRKKKKTGHEERSV